MIHINLKEIIYFLIQLYFAFILSNLIFAPIFYLITNLIYFPGAIVYRIVNKFFCDIKGISIYKIKYFQPFSLHPNYTVYTTEENKKSKLPIIGPYIINTLLCILFIFEYKTTQILQTEFAINKIWPYFSLWLGMSFGYFAIPTQNDIQQSKIIIRKYDTKMSFIDKNIYFLKLNLMHTLRFLYPYIVTCIANIAFFIAHRLYLKILINNLIKNF